MSQTCTCGCDCAAINKEKVKVTKGKMPKREIITSLSNLFKTIQDSTRLRILWALDQGEMCVCDIANVLEMTKSAVSHQLATLRKFDLIKFNKKGKEVYYSLDDDHIKILFEVGIEHINHKWGDKK